MTSARSIVLALALAACTSEPEAGTPDGASESVPETVGSESGGSESGGSETGGSETGAEPLAVSVKWIEVAASDYKLELQPGFDPAIHQYDALADGPDIPVYVDVLVDADLDAVLVNGVPAGLIGFRLWRSAPETDLVSPTMATIELERVDAVVPAPYAIDVVF